MADKKAQPIRDRLSLGAVAKALKAFERQGHDSYKFKKALRSKWMSK